MKIYEYQGVILPAEEAAEDLPCDPPPARVAAVIDGFPARTLTEQEYDRALARATAKHGGELPKDLGMLLKKTYRPRIVRADQAESLAAPAAELGAPIAREEPNDGNADR